MASQELFLCKGLNHSDIAACDFPADVHNLDSVYFAMYGVVMTILVVIGTIGNILNIIVFCSPKLWACVNYYLIALAVWDLALLVTSFSWWSLWAIYYHGATRLFGHHVYVLRYAYICGNVTITGCIWVIAILTVERYMAILHPLKHRTLNNGSRAKIVISTVSLAAFLFNAGRPFEIEALMEPCCDASGQLIVVHYVQPTELRMNYFYHLIYRVFGSLVLLYLIPCTILAVLTVRMCFALRQATRLRRTVLTGKTYDGAGRIPGKSGFSNGHFTENARNGLGALSSNNIGEICKNGCGGLAPASSGGGGVLKARAAKFFHKDKVSPHSSAKSEANTNRMLSVVLIKFLLCYTLPTINDILELAFSEVAYYSSATMELLIIASNTLVVLNSSCNFFIYIFTGKRFRTELLQLLTSCSYSKLNNRKLTVSEKHTLTQTMSPSRMSARTTPVPHDV